MFFFSFFTGSLLYLHFKCYSLSQYSPRKILFPLSSLCFYEGVPSPTQLPQSPSIVLHWGISKVFIEPRTSPPMESWQGSPLLHMQLEPCVGWWLSPWMLWGVWLVDNFVLPMRFETPSGLSVLSLTPLLENPCSVQWLAESICLCIWKALAVPLRRQPY